MKYFTLNLVLGFSIFIGTTLFQTVQSEPYNYGEALQKSIYFYDVQRAGNLPEYGSEPGKNRVFWRSDSVLSDGDDINVDLSGGFFDAGDHGKFGLPMAATFSFLALGAIEYLDAYDKSNQLVYLLENMKWAGDYFVAAHINDTTFVAGVGEGNLDHTFWGAPEIVHLAGSASIRESFIVDENNPGSDVTAATAAALASMHHLFQLAAQLNPQKYQLYYQHALTKDYLGHAISLYNFADQYRGKYSDSIPSIQPFYNSWSGYQDELVWGALWLYLATSDNTYLIKAETYFDDLKYANFRWTHNWDDASYGSLILLAMYSNSSNKSFYINKSKEWLDYWVDSLHKTPQGLAWLSEWGALRYSANTSLLAFIFADYLQQANDSSAAKYENFAQSQINYMLGDNEQSRSYVVGFGNNPPLRPHHRGASGVYTNNINHDPVDNLHTLYGALVGGPSQDGSYQDNRDDYIKNEVALDYNAGFTGALARMYQACFNMTSCQPLNNFPPTLTDEQKRLEFSVEAKVNAQGADFREYSLFIKNKTAYPARATEELTVRYYVNLKDDIQSGVNPSNVQLRINNLDGSAIMPGLRAYNESEGIYYVELKVLPSSNHGLLRPGGQSEHRREIQFRITMPEGYAEHDFSGDWSAFGIDLANQSNNRVEVNHITIFENAQLVYGLLPNEQETNTNDNSQEDNNDNSNTDDASGSSDSSDTTDDQNQEDNTNQNDDTQSDTDNNNTSDNDTTNHSNVVCNVDFTIDSQWNGGHVIQVKLTNFSGSTLTDWVLQANNLTSMVNSWNAIFTQNGQSTLVEAMNYNRNISNQESVNFGYQGSGSFILPSEVTLINGSVNHLCSINGQSSNSGTNSNDDNTGNDSQDNTTDDSQDTDQTDNNTGETNDNSNDNNSDNDSVICAISIEKDQWSTGATIRLNITNQSNSKINNWIIKTNLPDQATLSNGWGGQYSLEGNTLTITPKAWNASIPQSSSFGDIGFVMSFPQGSEVSDQSLQVEVDGSLCSL
ncbi:glycoside hydrolase family 9 protein [Thiotrichales bacterium 19X7-9]|nr:glycoside hydrolase family 9 protein [Thiotrichales bacterium 19X7-9]